MKLLLDSVERAIELNPSVRSQLRDRIATALRQAEAKKIEVENTRESAQENQVAAIEAGRLAELTSHKRQKVKQLMDRFNSLLQESKYRVAEEDVAEEVRKLEPTLPISTAAVINSRFLKNVNEMWRFRDLKQRNFVDALYYVQESAIPIPDEPPIVYPKAEVWEQLTHSRAKYKAMDLAGSSEGAEQRIAQLLDKEDNFEFPDVSLQDVVDTLASKLSIPIVIDKKALEDAGVGTDKTVNVNLRGITLRSALRLILGELELTYLIQDEVLQITTKDKAGEKLITKVYPVGDLVIPVISGGMGGGMMGGGMGGMGGGMGGMGGGMGGMGGGMGGMGGGMGGMGGGGFGGGGGFFAVGDDAAPKAKVETAKANKPASAKPEAAAAASKVPATQAPQKAINRDEVKPIVLTPATGVSRRDAWEQHFQSHVNDQPLDRIEHEAQVRETVRRLRAEAAANVESNPTVAEAKFAEIIAVIEAALRNRQVQAWMYEAMSLAMMASGQPIEEVERALMSAVDFSRNEEEMMNVAGYMVRIGLDDRALKLYREVAQGNPLRPEPYVCGLAIAKRLNNEAATRWACLGILSQAWPAEHRQIELDARRTAEAVLARMEKANRKQDHQEFVADLNAALLRDCVVKVSWTGNADIDVLIEEPTATICSLQNRRTTSGGVLVGDAFSNPRKQSVDGVAEYYVCPKGFSGQYRLLIRRVWGEVTAGKVTVEIATNYGGKEETYGKQQIPVGEKNAIVNFEVRNGRRVEPIEAEKIANLDRARLNMGQAILAQQFPVPAPQNADPGSTSSSTTVPLFPGGFVAPRFDPRFAFRRGAVGYRPIITQFPEGNQMDALAIISADRRYVRFTLFGTQPISSGITNVDTFSFVSANSSTGGGGGLGGGGGGIGGGGGGGGFGGGGQF